MAKSWKCPRCSNENDASIVTCARCGLLQGAVFVPTTWDAPPGTATTPPAMPGSAWLGDEPLRGAASPIADGTPAVDDLAAADDPHSAGDTTPAVSGWTSYGGDQAQAPAAPVPLWRRIPIGWVVVGVLVLGGGISSWYFGASRSDTGEIAKPGDLTATELRVGDCFDLKVPGASEIEDVAARPCVEEHEFELFYAGAVPEGEYPAEAVFEEYVNEHCVPAFTAYIGKGFQESELDVYWLFPTIDAWRQGDRTIQCAVFHPVIHRLTESLKGSKR